MFLSYSRMTVEIEELNRSMILVDIIHAVISVSLGLFDSWVSTCTLDLTI